ncbi:TniQ family protein [Phormidium sp. LEGE 05292]|uniref:TniQ family protein n=1 Tax=[Phormidium] sp. LEGE 05292 TaxID=767427 RepID=UPI00188094F4|nr:TniQ family protein [Phormidium sp. LEGE 05292]MBE9227255.1 TniQ family protein [Phormidium sp. LEGE 05292]
METVDNRSRLIEVEPLEGESLSHFLGRFRRANYLTTTGLGKLTGLGAVISRWEKLLLNPFPTRQELEALANVVGIDVERLGEMLPPKGVGIKHRPILLCAVCYGEFPWHRIEWQFKDRLGCDRHQLRLLPNCTNCQRLFPIPADWVQGECQHCFLPFATMAKRQKSIG